MKSATSPQPFALSWVLPVTTSAKASGIRSWLKLGRKARSQARQEPESARMGPAAHKPGSKEAKKGSMSISPGDSGSRAPRGECIPERKSNEV